MERTKKKAWETNPDIPLNIGRPTSLFIIQGDFPKTILDSSGNN